MEIFIILQEKYVDTEFHNKMNKSLHQYNNALANETANKAWDQLQRSFKCCGIMNYTDWSSNGIDIPFSCCKEINNLSCIPEEMFNGNKTKGCLEKLLRFNYDGMAIGIFVSLIGIFISINIFFLQNNENFHTQLKQFGYPNSFVIIMLSIILIFGLIMVLFLSIPILFCLFWYGLHQHSQRKGNF